MKVLAIGAHPDDIEIGCGGTLAKLRKEGAELYFVVATNGQAGSNKISPEKLTKIRKQEALEAAKELKVEELFFLDLMDGLTSYSREDKINLIEIIRQVKPDMIFTHSTTDRFSDHMLVSQLTIAAITGASGPIYQEVKGEPHTVKEIYGYEVWNPLNTYQIVKDITDTIAEKLQALLKHQSQIANFNYADAFQGLARYRGIMTGAGDYADVFEVITTDGKLN